MKLSHSFLAASLVLSMGSAFAANTDQRTDDTTTIQAYLGTRISPYAEGGATLNKALCGPLQGVTYPGSGFQDCSATVQASLKNSFDSQNPPLVTDFNFSANGAFCQVYEIRTVTKLSALNSPVFQGIGFSFEDAFVNMQNVNAQSNRGRFVPKAQLDQVGQLVILKDGEPALVHRFIARGACMDAGDDGYSIEFSTIMFRPYARFDDGTNQYTNWDSVSKDYILGIVPSPNFVGEAPHVNSFDRQADVLKQ